MGQKLEFFNLNFIGCFHLNAIKKLFLVFGSFSIVFSWLLVYVLASPSLIKGCFRFECLTCASSAITPQPITVYFFSLLSQSQVLNCCGVLRLTLIVRLRGFWRNLESQCV